MIFRYPLGKCSAKVRFNFGKPANEITMHLVLEIYRRFGTEGGYGQQGQES
jgi:hypothetical protein